MQIHFIPPKTNNYLQNIKDKDVQTELSEFIASDKNLVEPPNCVICLTDGYTSVPERQPGYPVLWILTHDGEELPWGTNIRFKK